MVQLIMGIGVPGGQHTPPKTGGSMATIMFSDMYLPLQHTDHRRRSTSRAFSIEESFGCGDRPPHSGLKIFGRMKVEGSQRRGLGRALKQHKARLYIIRRCVVMLLQWHD
ncbi:hypothetical protein ACQ4PT_052829 [Festuca glaucescens]